MATDDDVDDWPRDPASAVQLLELHLTFKHLNRNRDPETIAIPRDVAQVILECAKNGLHKGKGRSGVALGHRAKLCRESVVGWAKRRKAELLAANRDLSAVQATHQAAEEAVQLLLDRYSINLAASTIMRRMDD